VSASGLDCEIASTNSLNANAREFRNIAAASVLSAAFARF
jgi:hypothetical protein